MPIHKFVRDPKTREWHEILLDAADDKLKLTKARQRTLANQYIENDMAFDPLEAAEIAPKSGAIIETISERIVQHGGAALIADYGYEKSDGKTLRDTFRAFKDHKQCDSFLQIVI